MRLHAMVAIKFHGTHGCSLHLRHLVVGRCDQDSSQPIGPMLLLDGKATFGLFAKVVPSSGNRPATEGWLSFSITNINDG
jgi:hypothetical protein